MFAFGDTRPVRRPSLTPMIDVVFLLLVFFMLSSRFGIETGLGLASGGSGAGYQGPPRLVTVAANSLSLNGVAIAEARLPAALADLMQAPDDTIVLRAADGANLQRLVDVLEALQAAGYSSLAVIE